MMLFRARLADAAFRVSLALRDFATKHEPMVDEHFERSVAAREKIRTGDVASGLIDMTEQFKADHISTNLARTIVYSKVGSTERRRAERAVESVLINHQGAFAIEAMEALQNINRNLHDDISRAIDGYNFDAIERYGKRVLPFLVRCILRLAVEPERYGKLLVHLAFCFPPPYLSALAAIDPKGDAKLQILKEAATAASEKLTGYLIKVSEAMAHFSASNPG